MPADLVILLSSPVALMNAPRIRASLVSSLVFVYELLGGWGGWVLGRVLGRCGGGVGVGDGGRGGCRREGLGVLGGSLRVLGCYMCIPLKLCSYAASWVMEDMKTKLQFFKRYKGSRTKFVEPL